MSKVKTRRKATPSKPLFAVLICTLIAMSVSLVSCNVTRTTTTTSQFYQKGDTTVTIQTKTIESYDGSKK